MFRFIKIQSFLLIGVLFFFPAAVYSHSVCDGISIDTISQHLSMPEAVEIVQKHELGNICEVVLRTQNSLAPVYVGQGFVLIGQLFQNKESVTQKTMEALQQISQKENQELAREMAIRETYRKNFLKTHISDLEACVWISLVPEGEIKDQVYVITDPLCSHCKSALKSLAALSRESGILVKVIIYPVLGKESKRLTVEALCQKYSYQDYLEMKDTSRQLSAPCKAGKDYIKKTTRFLEKADIDSVPIIIGSKASWIVEGNKISEVTRFLHRNHGTDEKKSVER